jgi:hypothetical protein
MPEMRPPTLPIVLECDDTDSLMFDAVPMTSDAVLAMSLPFSTTLPARRAVRTSFCAVGAALRATGTATTGAKIAAAVPAVLAS